MTTQQPDMLLWLDDHRGVYIPRDFALSFVDRAKSVVGVSAEEWATLEAGPDTRENEWYWDTWDHVCNNAIVTDENGIKYTIYQDGACWLIPEGMEWSDKQDGFVWPSDDDDSEDDESPDQDELIL